MFQAAFCTAVGNSRFEAETCDLVAEISKPLALQLPPLAVVMCSWIKSWSISSSTSTIPVDQGKDHCCVKKTACLDI